MEKHQRGTLIHSLVFKQTRPRCYRGFLLWLQILEKFPHQHVIIIQFDEIYIIRFSGWMIRKQIYYTLFGKLKTFRIKTKILIDRIFRTTSAVFFYRIYVRLLIRSSVSHQSLTANKSMKTIQRNCGDLIFVVKWCYISPTSFIQFQEILVCHELPSNGRNK